MFLTTCKLPKYKMPNTTIGSPPDERRGRSFKLRISGLKLGMRTLAVTIVGIAHVAYAQEPKPNPSPILLRCGMLLQPTSPALERDVLVTVEGERIREVVPQSGSSSSKPSTTTIDLSDHTCLPGLIDAHTHVLLQSDNPSPEYYDFQLLKQSVAYRTILGTRSLRRALDYGFTTIRDLETEGAGYADVDLKNAVLNGIIPGPRMQVATRALDVTGAYPLQGYSPGVPVPHGAEVVDGPDEGRKAVREQISYGADWIKLYADHSNFIRNGIVDGIPTFTADELRAIVDEAHREHHKVAAHAMGVSGVHNAVEAGVDSIEHGYSIADDDMKSMIRKGIYYVPTLFAGEYNPPGRPIEQARTRKERAAIHAETFRKAVNAGVQIAFGTDVGGFDWAIDPAVEFPLMVRYGMSAKASILAATTTAARLLDMQDDLAAIAPGKYADIVALRGNPLQDVSLLQQIDFVMKDGVIFKSSTQPKK